MLLMMRLDGADGCKARHGTAADHSRLRTTSWWRDWIRSLRHRLLGNPTTQLLSTSLHFMYFCALMDCVILHLLLLSLYVLRCLYCTVIQLFGYLHSRKCAK